MCKVILSVIVLVLGLHHSYQYEISTIDIQNSEHDNHFDKLMFVQKWPVSYCKDSKQVNPGGECVFPHKKNRWIVHGIWPGMNENDFPEYCNKSWPFDPEQVRPIEDDLEEVWTTINKGDDHYAFWAHEWNRHGTCAAVLEPFNTQLKFFSKGIEWNQKYSLSDILAAANMFPNDTKELSLEEFVNAMKAKTKVDPMVVCKKFDENSVPFIWELRICLDKQFNHIDCNPVSKNCAGSKIIYPANA